MKRISLYIIALSAMAFTSCDNFLDIKPVGKVIPTTYQDYRDLMTNAYETVPTDRSLSTVRGDELQLIYDDWGDYLPYHSLFIWKDINPDANTKDLPWQQFYKAILNANQVIIDGEKAADGTKEQIDQVRGEAYLMRAYMHFGLASLYSDVYSTENLNKKSVPLATTIDIWKNYERNTIGEVYKQIFSDIEDGLKLLNVDEQPKGTNYRFSKISAYGFAARVYAYTGDWENARKYALQAYEINNKLVDLNSSSAKLPQNYASDENVLAMEQTFYSELKTRFNVSDKLISAFDKTNDLRFAKYFEAKGTGYRCSLGYTLANKVSMRTAEFYLLLAASEAQVSGGDLTKAKSYLKQLLSKRLKADYYNSQATAIDAMGKDAFLQRVADERFRELACQGFRWYDLRYFGKQEITKTFNGESYTLTKGDSRYILPFPTEATEANPNLLN
ncbi:RagB/SusD family nutrient uptake outer membrane protein [uncultured Bacteroides sp.]|uniref:RagB/SusD family nutrient uptake outer membrane protein n=1 Tax=uncultured Bacteroides sp. TaxID=162156 RepID=UPI002AAB2B65|nr:RagB/SusD family nutrient uptake outer membrane protein [uncultured Bacteroides sp.]